MDGNKVFPRVILVEMHQGFSRLFCRWHSDVAQQQIGHRLSQQKHLHVAAALGLCCCGFALCFTDKIHLEDVLRVPAIQPNHRIIKTQIEVVRVCRLDTLVKLVCFTALVYPCTCNVFLCLNSLGERRKRRVGRMRLEAGNNVSYF